MLPSKTKIESWSKRGGSDQPACELLTFHEFSLGREIIGPKDIITSIFTALMIKSSGRNEQGCQGCQDLHFVLFLRQIPAKLKQKLRGVLVSFCCSPAGGVSISQRDSEKSGKFKQR